MKDQLYDDFPVTQNQAAQHEFDVTAATQFVEFKQSANNKLNRPQPPPYSFEELCIPKRVHEKFNEMIARREQIRPPTFAKAWNLSRLHSIPEVDRHDIFTVFKLKDVNCLWTRYYSLNAKTSVVFLGYKNIIFEIVSWRGIRTLCAKWRHRKEEEKLSGGSPKDRITAIAKHNHRQQIQGGLIRQEKQPRDRYSNIRAKTYS